MWKRLGKVIAAGLLFSFAALLVALHTHPGLGRWEAYLADEDMTRPRDDALRINWLGTSTVHITDGTTHLLTDGFFSRPSLVDLATGPIAPDEQRIRENLSHHGIKSLDAVIAVHSHYDHAMDAPLVAQLTGATLTGSESTANVGRGLPLPEQQIDVVSDGDTRRYGDFEVTYIASDHVPQNALVDRATGIDQAIETPLSPPAWINAWKEGTSWTLLFRHPMGTVMLQGSAGFRPGQLAGHRADLALVSSTGLFRQSDAFQRDYVANTITASGAGLVVPIHWDDFFVALADDGSTPPLPWIIEHMNGSFSALLDGMDLSHSRFMVARPGQPFWFSAAAGPETDQLTDQAR